jgi:hypothetical protein
VSAIISAAGRPHLDVMALKHMNQFAILNNAIPATTVETKHILTRHQAASLSTPAKQLLNDQVF